jgi:hypothetical protein
MDTALPLILLLTIVLPIAWFASEFQDRRWIRISAGIVALTMSFLVAAGVGSLQHLNANAWYGGASKNLIDTTIEEIERGDTERLLKELKILQKQFQPTYENRARYDKLIEEFMSRLGREWKHAV